MFSSSPRSCAPQSAIRMLLPPVRWIALLASALLPLGLAAQTFSTSGSGFVGYVLPGYLIDADRTVDYNNNGTPFDDASYNRWYLRVQATGTVSGGDPEVNHWLRMGFSLLETGTDNVIPLQQVTGASTGNAVTALYTAQQIVSTNTSTVFSGNLVVDPAYRLDPNKTYRVRAQLQRGTFLFIGGILQLVWSDAGSPHSGGIARSFVHFKGPWGTDAARNVVARGTSHTITKPFAVRSTPAQSTFSTSVGYTLYRYDEAHTGSSVADTITVRLTAELYDTAVPGVAIAMAQSVFTDSPTLARSSSSGGVRIPTVSNESFTVNFQPNVALDPVNKQYQVRVTVAHLEVLSPANYITSNAVTTTAARLLHLSGKLSFGSIQTTLSAVTSVATPGTLSGSFVNTSLTNGQGSLDGGSGHAYGPGNLNIAVNSMGDAFCLAPSSITLNAPSSPDTGSIAGISFNRGVITLSSSGASAASLSALFPAGFGLANDPEQKRLDPRLTVPGPVALTQQLLPLHNPSVPLAFPRWAVEETKPVAMEVSQVNWSVSTGVFTAIPSATASARYVRNSEMEALEAAPVPASERLKRSNELYYRTVVSVDDWVVVRAGFNGGAEMSTRISFGGSARVVRGHFPWDATFAVAGGKAKIEWDRYDPAASYLDLDNKFVKLLWASGCAEPACDPLASSGDSVLFEVPNDGFGNFRLGISADGGLYAGGLIPTPLDLRWGFIPAKADYAHRVNTPMIEGRLAIAGHFVHGEDGLGGGAGQLMGPGTILLSGVNEDGKLTERPLLTFNASSPYQQGFADYPGLNFRLGPPNSADSGVAGRSLLGGEVYGPYALKNRSKYYIRMSGVTGIHDKVPTAPEAVEIYGYNITLTNFGLAFLSNSVADSRTSGSIFLPYPSNINVGFDELTFHCNGALDNMEVAAGSSAQTLAYWTAPIDILAMGFAPADKCDVDEGYLTLGVAGYSSHVNEPLHGTFGVFNHGNLIPKQFADTVPGLAGIDSRLKMPSKVTIRGPKRQTTVGGDEEYFLTPIADAYLNNPGLPGSNWTVSQAAHPIGTGYINLVGQLKVAFFQAMPVHMQTSSNRPPAPGDPAGSWGTAILHVAKGQWQVGGSSSSYFDGGYHDQWNRGFPYPSGAGAGGSGDSLAVYRESPAYYPWVQQTWLGGAITLKYKVQWNSTTRSFKSLDAADSVDAGDGFSGPDTRKFAVIEIDHRLTYLSAERAELTFGAEYSGLPTINLTNMVVNQLDELTGIFKAASDAGLDLIFDGLNGAIDDLARALNDNLRGFYQQVLDPPLNLFVDGVYSHLHTQWNLAGSAWKQFGVVPDVSAQFQNTLQTQVLNQLSPAASGALGQLGELVRILTVVENSLITVRDDFLATDPNTEQLVAIRTLTRELIKVLSAEVGGSLGSILDGLGVDQRLADLIDPLLVDIKPTVAQIHSVISDLTDVVSEIRGTLDGVVSFDFQAHLQGIFDGANAEFAAVKSEIENHVRTKLAFYGPTSNFLARDPEEVKTMIREAVYDWLLDTFFVEQVQVAVKQRLQDVEHSIRQGLDSAFAQVNTLVKDSISEFLSGIDDQINGALGAVSDKMGSASLKGYAIFNGDAMRKVRIDGKFTFNIPSETTIKAYLEINQYTSADQPPGCVVLGPGEAMTEVEIGALDVGCDFISPDLRVNLAVKFTMESGPGKWSLKPTGFGGSFEMASGEISFEAFKITELKCGIMFGTTENYVTAALGMRFGSYGAKGGIFFGRTCTLDPIKLWDPLVASAIGEPSPSFTGAYVYGEAHIPVSEVILGVPATCFFKITADVGAGFFFFVEGPTYGARLGLGVGGEVLCLVSIGGRVDMVGARVGNVTKLKGKGSVYGEIGPCSFCIKFNKSVEMETQIGSDGKMAGKGGTK
jgi:hypothetical protein